MRRAPDHEQTLIITAGAETIDRATVGSSGSIRYITAAQADMTAASSRKLPDPGAGEWVSATAGAPCFRTELTARPLESVQVQLHSGRVHEKDCEDCETEDVGINRIERRIELRRPLSDEQRARILAIADRCPVKQTLQRTSQVVSADSGATT